MDCHETGRTHRHTCHGHSQQTFMCTFTRAIHSNSNQYITYSNLCSIFLRMAYNNLQIGRKLAAVPSLHYVHWSYGVKMAMLAELGEHVCHLPSNPETRESNPQQHHWADWHGKQLLCLNLIATQPVIFFFFGDSVLSIFTSDLGSSPSVWSVS